MESTSLSKASQFTEATEIFHLPEGVHVFSITPEGCVLATNTDTQSTLRILRYNHSPLASTSDVESTTFLQVGTWTYPLLPGTYRVTYTVLTKYIKLFEVKTPVLRPRSCHVYVEYSYSVRSR